MSWRVLSVLATAAVAAVPAVAAACTCIEATTEERYARAERVFEGVAQGRKEREFTSGLSIFRARFAVKRAWKGAGSGTVEVRMEDNTCDADFEDGGSYIVFAHKDEHYRLPGLWTYRCSGTQSSDESRGVVEALDRIAAERRQAWGRVALVVAGVVAIVGGVLVAASRRRLRHREVPEEGK